MKNVLPVIVSAVASTFSPGSVSPRRPALRQVDLEQGLDDCRQLLVTSPSCRYLDALIDAAARRRVPVLEHEREVRVVRPPMSSGSGRFARPDHDGVEQAVMPSLLGTRSGRWKKRRSEIWPDPARRMTAQRRQQRSASSARRVLDRECPARQTLPPVSPTTMRSVKPSPSVSPTDSVDGMLSVRRGCSKHGRTRPAAAANGLPDELPRFRRSRRR